MSTGIATAHSDDSGYADAEDGPLFTNYGTTLSASGSTSSLFTSGSSTPDSEDVDTDDNVSVIVRIRPLNSRELSRKDTTGLQFPGDGRIVVDSFQNNNKPKLFSYNVVFEPGATQDDVFEHSGIKKLINMAIDGFSCTVFAYGQTGSGKTYTLTGPPFMLDGNKHPYEHHGLMVRSFTYLFKQLQLRQDTTYVIHASFLEIYNEQVADLLNPGPQRKYLQVRWSKDKGFYVENLFIVECVEYDDVLAVMEEGLRNRQVAATNLNENSSRSHCILTLSITSEIRDPDDENTYVTKHGKLSFVDLAGSEKVRETHSQGGTFNEANKINRSLLTLGKCISALGDLKKKNGHIPYRDSKLTKLLADSLGGNGVTLMIACVSPSRSNLGETLSTLRYAARTKHIRNKPVVIMDPRETLILSLKREVKLLRAENQYLRQQLAFPQKTETKMSATMKASSLESLEKLREAAEGDGQLPPEVNPKELYTMLREYMIENEALRSENGELLASKEQLTHDQETVCRENERLTKKLEELKRSSKLSPVRKIDSPKASITNPTETSTPDFNPTEHLGRKPRGAFPGSVTTPITEALTRKSRGTSPDSLTTTPNTDPLGESINLLGPLIKYPTTNIWVNPNASIPENNPVSKAPDPLVYRPPHRLPESISKELQRRKIGTDVAELSRTSTKDKLNKRLRRNSWDNGTPSRGGTPLQPMIRSAGDTPSLKPTMPNSEGRMIRSHSDQALPENKKSAEKKGTAEKKLGFFRKK